MQMTLAYEHEWCFGNTKEDEPKVILTVDEAKEIYWLLEGHRKDYAKIDWLNDREARLVLLKKEGALNEKWREALPKRIEQAEINHAKGDI
jgi:hypothetical protein